MASDTGTRRRIKMKIVEVDIEEYNQLQFDRKELLLKDTAGNLMLMAKWANGLGAKIIYKYKRPNGIKWIVEVK